MIFSQAQLVSPGLRLRWFEAFHLITSAMFRPQKSAVSKWIFNIYIYIQSVYLYTYTNYTYTACLYFKIYFWYTYKYTCVHMEICIYEAIVSCCFTMPHDWRKGQTLRNMISNVHRLKYGNTNIAIYWSSTLTSLAAGPSCSWRYFHAPHRRRARKSPLPGQEINGNQQQRS